MRIGGIYRNFGEEVLCFLSGSLAYFSALKMEKVSSSETSATLYELAWKHTLEDSSHDAIRFEKFKFQGY
jgi:hypothetical protein